MNLRWLFSLLMACSIPAGEHHQLSGLVVEVGGSTLILEHGGSPGLLDAATTPFVIDPNLARSARAGETVKVNLLVPPDGGAMRVIGIEKQAP